MLGRRIHIRFVIIITRDHLGTSAIWVDKLYVIFKIFPFSEPVITHATFELIVVFYFVNFKIFLRNEVFVTQITLMIAWLIMDQFMVAFDIVLPCKPVPTQITFILLHTQVCS